MGVLVVGFEVSSLLLLLLVLLFEDKVTGMGLVGVVGVVGVVGDGDVVNTRAPGLWSVVRGWCCCRAMEVRRVVADGGRALAGVDDMGGLELAVPVFAPPKPNDGEEEVTLTSCCTSFGRSRLTRSCPTTPSVWNIQKCPLLGALRHCWQGWVIWYPITFPHTRQATSRILHLQLEVV